MTRRPFVASVAAVASMAVLLSGCGTRASEAEVRAGARNSAAVALDQASIEALTAAAAQVAAAPAGGPAAAPGTGGAPAPGGLPGVAPTGPTKAGKPGAAAPTPAAATGNTAGSADAGKCTAAGAPVSLGQVGTFSGLAGPIAGDGLAAMALWAKDVNARGGLA